jgi:cytidyltransferase-like protein
MNSDESAVGAVCGRFQMPHLGHMEYIIEAKKKCRLLYVGITNPGSFAQAQGEETPHRAYAFGNPLTYYERLEMLRGSILAAGVKEEAFRITPFPLENPPELHYFIPLDAVFYLTLYDEWSLKKQRLIENEGFRTHILWQRRSEDKITSGSEIRALIAANKEWRHLVPPFVYDYAQGTDIENRIKLLYRQIAEATHFLNDRIDE